MVTLEKLGERFHYPTGDYIDRYTFLVDGKKVNSMHMDKHTDFRKGKKLVYFHISWYESWDKTSKKIIGDIICKHCTTLQQAKDFVEKMVEAGGYEAHGMIWAA